MTTKIYQAHSHGLEGSFQPVMVLWGHQHSQASGLGHYLKAQHYSQAQHPDKRASPSKTAAV